MAVEADDLAVDIVSQIVCHDRCHSCREKRHQYCSNHRQQRNLKHYAAGTQQIMNLKAVKILTKRFILFLYKQNCGLCRHRIWHICNLFLKPLQHLHAGFLRKLLHCIQSRDSFRQLHRVAAIHTKCTVLTPHLFQAHKHHLAFGQRICQLLPFGCFDMLLQHIHIAILRVILIQQRLSVIIQKQLQVRLCTGAHFFRHTVLNALLLNPFIYNL